MALINFTKRLYVLNFRTEGIKYIFYLNYSKFSVSFDCYGYASCNIPTKDCYRLCSFPSLDI